MSGPRYNAAEYLADAAKDIVAACRARGWRLDWSSRGCYLMLESAELIEALRGKGTSLPADEAADVLLVLLSILGAYDIDAGVVLWAMENKLAAINAGTVGGPSDIGGAA